MENLRLFLPSFIWIASVFCCNGIAGVEGYVKYNTGGGTVDGKLNVHLVAHSHDDVGWLKTVDQYYIGTHKNIQDACVENILDSVVMSLRRDPNRKFIYAEMAFFDIWWKQQSAETQAEVRKLVNAGQLEFVNGGWCMHDEATTHYIDMIDQTTLGHQFIKSQFNKTPRAGWQIDPFGHSAVQAYLLTAEVGLDSVHFARIDYKQRSQCMREKSLEVIWRGSRTFGSSSQIFANAFPIDYGPPNGFQFEVHDEIKPVQDDPSLSDFNVENRVNDFVSAAMVQAEHTRTNHIMWTMGDDFKYQYAESWFKEMDKLIHYVNKDGRVNALYSTPSIYTDAKHASNEAWPLKLDDYFPYASAEYTYWTGFYTSRPALKRYIRLLSGYYLAARQLEFLVGRQANGSTTDGLGVALGIAQHHDAITGTAKQNTTDDYTNRLFIGAKAAETVVDSALSCLLSSKLKGQCAASKPTFGQCKLFNISVCRSTEADIPQGKSLVVVAYNPIGWNRTDIIRIPVNNHNLVVKDSTGKVVESQYLEVDNVTTSLREAYMNAYRIPDKLPAKYWLVFPASVPPLGWNTYFICQDSQKGNINAFMRVADPPMKETIEIGPGNLKLSFSSKSGLLRRMFNAKTGVDIPVQQGYHWYPSSNGDATSSQGSGAYIFRPSASTHAAASTSVPLKIIRGPLVHEVHKKFNSWISQIIRVYKGKDHAEFEFTVGPIPDDRDGGKEVITRLTTNMDTNKVFYTDSNSRDFLKRIRDYRANSTTELYESAAGNYYPITLGIFIEDRKSEFSVLVDRSAGGSSLKDGEIELMLHRRCFYDDNKGVAEALNEQVCVNTTGPWEGITARGSYYVSIDKPGKGAKWRRTAGQEIYSPLLLAFAQEDSEKWGSSHVASATTMESDYRLPSNVALITLQETADGSVLLRLAHLYQAGEDPNHSTLAKVELKKMFAGKSIKGLRETSLSANQDKSEMKRKNWKVKGSPSEAPVIRGGPVDISTLVVELGPMEIRTFTLTF